jgi:hypothetical protein
MLTDFATNQPQRFGSTTDWAKFAHGMVSIWLTPVNCRDLFKTRGVSGVENVCVLRDFGEGPQTKKPAQRAGFSDAV